MASFFREGQKLSFEGFKGNITRITETYRKNVIVIKVDQMSTLKAYRHMKADYIGIFEYPDGKLEFMSVID